MPSPPPGAMFYSSYNCATNVVMRVVTQQHLSLKLALNVMSAVHKIGEPHTHRGEHATMREMTEKWVPHESLSRGVVVSGDTSVSRFVG